MKTRKILIFSFVAIVVAVASVYITFSVMRNQVRGFSHVAADRDKKDQEPIVVTIPKGSTLPQIAKILYESKVINDIKLFDWYVRYSLEKADKLKAGEYELNRSMTPEEIVAILESGKQREFRFTVPEGIRKEEIARIIAAAGFSDEKTILDIMNDPEFIKSVGVPKVGAGGQKTGVSGGVEGYLYPDTYQFPKSTTPKDILKKMRKRIDEVIDAEMQAKMDQMKWDLHKVLTLASIVEKETAAKAERPHIARIFLNRLDKKMKLQTDPTIIYGIKDYDGNIKRSDILDPHAATEEESYNTYVIKGLPPGPIATAGKEAIRAVLFPDDGDDLYFVAKGDSGEHQFCPTLECHNAAVKKWQVDFFKNKPK